jgi:hypothetical protein
MNAESDFTCEAIKIRPSISFISGSASSVKIQKFGRQHVISEANLLRQPLSA